MYAVVLMLHSGWRWLVLLVLLVRGLRGAQALIQGSPYGQLDQRLSIATIAVIDMQLLLGLILYGLSPSIRLALSDPGGAMKNSVIRLVFVEHPLMMLLAIGAVHAGHAMAKKTTRPDASRHRIGAAFALLGLLFVLSRLPG